MVAKREELRAEYSCGCWMYEPCPDKCPAHPERGVKQPISAEAKSELPSEPVKVERWFNCVKLGCTGHNPIKAPYHEQYKDHAPTDWVECDRAGVPLSEGAKENA